METTPKRILFGLLALGCAYWCSSAWEGYKVGIGNAKLVLLAAILTVLFGAMAIVPPSSDSRD